MRLNSKKVKEIMREQKLTAEILCSRTGLSMKPLYFILQGGPVSTEALERIADSIGRTVQEISLPDISSSTENTIEFTRDQQQATVTFSQGRYISRIRGLAAERLKECEILAENSDGSICAHVPVAWVRIIPPREYTDEQRQAIGARLHRK